MVQMEVKRMARQRNGGMSVREAGHKGGQKVKQLIEEGKKAMESKPAQTRRK